jgi:XRE family aerobic/anaerobic benzoate catabolism transcriptional regulator
LIVMTAERKTTGETAPRDLLGLLARRVRRLRDDHAWTRSELARRSGLSERFLARVESGDGNISVRRLESLATALETTPDRLVRPAADSTRIVALVGLRGAGKSTLGPLVARALGWPFVEIDQRIVEASGLTLDQLFELHGEPYYRRLEHEILRSILAREGPAVVAAGGGVVNDSATWDLLCRRATVVWLRASPEDHWNRVVAQGDRRPMADHPGAMEELRALLAARETVYAEAAITIDTAAGKPPELAERIAGLVNGCGGSPRSTGTVG